MLFDQAVAVLDSVADRTVLGGYSRLGYHLRRQTWPRNDPVPGSLRGAVAVVTGANSGLGKATTTGLARLGATVVMLVRNRERGETARAEVTATVPGADLGLAVCDVADLDAVRDVAGSLVAEHPRIDVLVHNAGTLPEKRSESPQGHELTLATHVLGPLLLTELVRPALSEAPAARVVLVSSGGMYTQSLPVDDIEYRRDHYRGATAYARTKRIQVALTPLLAERYATDGVGIHTMHPGWADTPGVASSLPGFHSLTRPLLRTPAEGADTVVWLAGTERPLASGRFWHDRRDRPTHYLPSTRHTREQARRVWNYCADAVAIPEE